MSEFARMVTAYSRLTLNELREYWEVRFLLEAAQVGALRFVLSRAQGFDVREG